MEHNPDCDVNDQNPDGIRKPCNCRATREIPETYLIFVSHVMSSAALDSDAPRCVGCGLQIVGPYISHSGHWHYSCAAAEAARRHERWM